MGLCRTICGPKLGENRNFGQVRTTWSRCGTGGGGFCAILPEGFEVLKWHIFQGFWHFREILRPGVESPGDGPFWAEIYGAQGPCLLSTERWDSTFILLSKAQVWKVHATFNLQGSGPGDLRLQIC